jgi:hypothetical protein
MTSIHSLLILVTAKGTIFPVGLILQKLDCVPRGKSGKARAGLERKYLHDSLSPIIKLPNQYI